MFFFGLSGSSPMTKNRSYIIEGSQEAEGVRYNGHIIVIRQV